MSLLPRRQSSQWKGTNLETVGFRGKATLQSVHHRKTEPQWGCITAHSTNHLLLDTWVVSNHLLLVMMLQ